MEKSQSVVWQDVSAVIGCLWHTLKRNLPSGVTTLQEPVLKAKAVPRGCRVQQEPRWQLLWALLYNIQRFQCLQTPGLHNKTLVGGKRQQQPRFSQLRHFRVPLSCKRESHLCSLSSKPCLPSFSDSGASSLRLFSPFHKTSPSSYFTNRTHVPQEVP